MISPHERVVSRPDRSRSAGHRGCYHHRMPATLTSRLLKLIAVALALVPWLSAMYFFYWLDASGTWTADTPHRGKLSVIILVTGMGLSFLLLSRVRKRG